MIISTSEAVRPIVVEYNIDFILIPLTFNYSDQKSGEALLKVV